MHNSVIHVLLYSWKEQALKMTNRASISSSISSYGTRFMTEVMTQSAVYSRPRVVIRNDRLWWISNTAIRWTVHGCRCTDVEPAVFCLSPNPFNLNNGRSTLTHDGWGQNWEVQIWGSSDFFFNNDNWTQSLGYKYICDNTSIYIYTWKIIYV